MLAIAFHATFLIITSGGLLSSTAVSTFTLQPYNKTRDLDFAVGIIWVTFPVPAIERGADARNLIYRLDDLRSFEIIRQPVTLGINIGCDMMCDLPGIAAQAHITVEGH